MLQQMHVIQAFIACFSLMLVSVIAGVRHSLASFAAPHFLEAWPMNPNSANAKVKIELLITL